MKNKIVKTSDGSHSLYVEELDEHYHSYHGAIQEAKHVFIKNGFNYFNNSLINILEVGFGTGLNALLTYLEADKKNLKVNYSGLELYPVPISLIKQLNYVQLMDVQSRGDIFTKMHTAIWDSEVHITSDFNLHKIHKSLFDVSFNPQKFDLVYFDAFGPRAQNEMWNKNIFESIYNWLKPGGVLVTYCAMGQLKRDLKACGFEVESLPGPPGKREMTRALKR